MRIYEEIVLDIARLETKISKTKAAIPAILVRFILTAVVVVAYWNSEYSSKLPLAQRLPPVLAFIFCVYFLCMLFVFCIRLTGNYIVGSVATLLAAVGVAAFMAYVGELSAFWGNALAIVCFVGFLGLFLRDIYMLVTLPKKHMDMRKLEKEYIAGGRYAAEMQEAAAMPQVQVSSAVTNDITFAERAAASLEKTLGRKPTEDELNSFLQAMAETDKA